MWVETCWDLVVYGHKVHFGGFESNFILAFDPFCLTTNFFFLHNFTSFPSKHNFQTLTLPPPPTFLPGVYESFFFLIFS